MADTKLASMTAASALSGTDLFYTDQSGDRKATGTQIKALVLAGAITTLGAADAAAPVAQTLNVQNVVTGTLNTAGAALTISGSQGTGTGAGGSIVFKTAPVGGSGTSQNALATAMTIDSKQQLTFPGIWNGSDLNILFANACGFGSINNEIRVVRGGLGFFSLDTGAGQLVVKGSSGSTYGGSVGFGIPGNPIDCQITGIAANTVQLGAADAAAPVAQTLTVQSVVAGTSNTAGADFTISGSKGTGTGTGGSIIFNASPGGGSGTSQNAGITLLTLSGGTGVSIGNSAHTAIVLTVNGGSFNLGRESSVTGALTVNFPVRAPVLWTPAVTFASRFGAPVEGMTQAFTDSTASSGGTVITGGGSNHVLGYYTGTNWVVASGTGSGGGGLAVGSSAISGGTSTRLLYDNAGVLGEFGAWDGTNLTLNNASTHTANLILGDGTALVTDPSISFTTALVLQQRDQNSHPSLTLNRSGAGIAHIGYSDSGTNGLDGFHVASTGAFGFASGGAPQGTLDVILTRNAAAALQLGRPDAAAPVAQTLTVQSVVAGTSNTAGANFTISGSKSTGTGAGGSIIFKTAPVGSTGTSQNALVTALTIDSTAKATFSDGTFEIVVQPSLGVVVNQKDFRIKDAGGNDVSTYGVGSGGLGLRGTYLLMWGGSTGNWYDVIDTYFGKAAAATFRFGNVDAAAPIAQTLTVQSVVAGTNNTAGADFTISGSKGTGTGAGGSIVFKTALAGSTGTSQNTLVTVATLDQFGSLIVPGDGTGNNAAHVQYSLSGVNNGFYGGTDGFAFSQGGVPIFGISSFWNTGISIHSTWILGWNSGNAIASNPDTVLRRAAAATLALGNADAAAPVAQTLQVQSVVAGTASGTVGQNFTINGSRGTGTGIGGSIIFQTAAAGGVSTAQNALAPALTLDSTKLATFTGAVDIQSGTSARSFRVYNTYSSAGANYERGVMDWTANSNVLTIGTQNLGTGVARNLMFIVGGGTQLDYGLSTASRWSFGSGVNLVAGTSSNPPLTFQNGTLLTTAAAGALEYDGKVHYATSVASARQILNAEQVQNLTATRTLANNTTAQAIFNATTNGALTLAAATTYEFEMLVAATGFSASAHTLNFGFGGTATFTSIGYFYDAQAGSTLAGPAASFTGFVAAAAATPIIASNTTTGLVLRVRGTIRINAGGTVIPQLTQVTASAAAVVQVNSFFRCWPAGSDTTASVGNWS